MSRRAPGAADDDGRLAGAIARHPREFVAGLMAALATLAIFINALYLQHGPHPAPIFAIRAPEPVVTRQAVPLPPRPADNNEAQARTRVQVISDIQRELIRRGFYDGAVDGVWGTKTDAAARDFAQAAGLKTVPEVGDALLKAITTSAVKPQASSPVTQGMPRKDPIAELIMPAKRVLAIQCALADFGYGQINPTGVADADTKTAIETFERERHLPVTGQISDRLARELSSATGRPLE